MGDLWVVGDPPCSVHGESRCTVGGVTCDETLGYAS